MNTRLSEMNLPRFPLLSSEEMKALLYKTKAGDPEARERLINCNLKLVFNIVQRFINRGYEPEDLFQIGTIGLIKAIDKFDMSYDVKFSTYAVPLIIGEIRRFLRDDNPVKVSRGIKEAAGRVSRVREELVISLGREPTVSEIAEAVGMKREEIVTVLEAVQTPSSIHETLYQDDGDPIYVMDAITGEKGDDAGWFDRLAMKEILGRLPERDRQVLILRFFEDKTQSEVASLLRISQVQVSRIERQALKNLKALMDANDEECR